MGEELFFTGYCRCLDCSRTVSVYKQTPESQPEIDCSFPDCPHRAACHIAKELEKL